MADPKTTRQKFDWSREEWVEVAPDDFSVWTRPVPVVFKRMSDPDATAPRAEFQSKPHAPSVHDIQIDELLRRAALSDRPVKRGGRPRWNAVMDRFQLGSTYAWQLCRSLGIDPEEMVHR